MAYNIADLFEYSVDAVPERVGLIVDDEQMTYAELEAAANRTAHHLLEQGVDIRVIQGLLGHRQITSTTRYARVALHTIRRVKSPLELLDLAALELREREVDPRTGLALGAIDLLGDGVLVLS